MEVLPHPLSKVLNGRNPLQHSLSKGNPICILNGACGAHNSWNEFCKIQRDLPSYKPDIVISFSGINDFKNHVHPENPYLNTHLIKEMSESGAFSGVLIPPTIHDHADAWLQRSLYMHSVCQCSALVFYGYYNQPLIRKLFI